MSGSIDSQLNETLRDALVAYYLDEIVPHAPEFVGAGLSEKIQTANDLYQYKLLDVQVSQAVPTSAVASAIASLQQYINAALMGMEPGYETKVVEEHLVRQWREITSRYSIWSANQQLSYYPELFIDPALRMNKSAYFQQLENDINQNKIHVDTTQEAVLSYLSSFEEVANLTIINGYITTTDFKNGMYYFIGKSRAESVYYWRSVDMSQRVYKNMHGTDPNRPKFDYPPPGAWSDWHKANLPISASAIERTIRPVLFNERLFVFWVECVDSNPSAITIERGYAPGDEPKPPAPGSPMTSVTSNPLLRLNMVYKKYDDSWSVPQTCIEAWSEALLFKRYAVQTLVDSIAVADSTTTPGSMFVAMYAGYTAGGVADGSLDKYEFLKTALIDQNFNITHLFPSRGYAPSVGITADIKERKVLNIGRLFARDNDGRLQFALPVFNIAVKSVSTTSPFKGSVTWDHSGYQSGIVTPRPQIEVKYNAARQALEFTTGITKAISGRAFFEIVMNSPDPYYGKMRLKLYCPDEGSEEYSLLLEGSEIEVIEGVFMSASVYIFSCYDSAKGLVASFFISDTPSTMQCTIGRLSPGEKFSLAGKVVKKLFIDGFASVYRVSVSKYGTNTVVAYYDNVGKTHVKPNYFLQALTRPRSLENFPPANAYTLASIALGPASKDIPVPGWFHRFIPIDSDSLLPDWGFDWPVGTREIPIIHGTQVWRTGIRVGSAYRLTTVVLEYVPSIGTALIAPRIFTRASPTLGTAEFIDYRGSSIGLSDDGKAPRQPIRMNTLFVRELINRANIALEYLLSWLTQLLEEPPLDPPAATNLMDFHGANSKYFWELFLHLPFMVSHRLYQEQNFDGAEKWLGFIFDPSRKKDSQGRPDYWNVRPLMDDPVEMDYATRNPVDPDGIASSHPARYRKAIYLFYLKILLARGDAAYRDLTPDSLAEAKLWYVRISDLLGPRPDINVVDHWQAITLKTFSDATDPKLREFEQRLIEQDQLREESAAANSGESLYHFAEPPLYLRTFASDPTLAELDNPHKRLPFNDQLFNAWNAIESRLENLRNNRTLDGKPLMLALFAAPLNPRDLLAAFGQGAASGGGARLLAHDVPPYRFSVMHNRAHSAVDTLTQFGNTLLSLIERKEQAQLQELNYHQAWEFAQFAVDLQQQAQIIDLEQKKALEASKALAQGRLDFYRRLADEITNHGEILAASLHLLGRGAEGAMAVANVFAGGLTIAPNTSGVVAGAHMGFSNGAVAGASLGGWRLEGVPQMVAAAASGAASLLHGSADALDRVEQFRRRHQEWVQAGNQAALEIAQIEAQMQVLEAQVHATTLQLTQARAAQEQALASYDFLRTRFSNAQLYQWLNGQFATLYYQAYDATLALCLAAEACWQFEIADFSSRFIQAGVWKDSYRGLSAGEALKLSLLKMEAAYLRRNERLLEITKTVSLRQLKAKDPASTINQDWDTLKARLLEEGRIDFELTQPMFDSNYPGHTLRRIQRISVSLPVVLGPYEDIHATLTQTYSAVQIGNTLKENLRASQQIALSDGVDDDGLFTFSFHDDRYLPFEGTGAISRWTLEFTADDPEERRRVGERVTDMIVGVHYTAMAG